MPGDKLFCGRSLSKSCNIRKCVKCPPTPFVYHYFGLGPQGLYALPRDTHLEKNAAKLYPGLVGDKRERKKVDVTNCSIKPNQVFLFPRLKTLLYLFNRTLRLCILKCYFPSDDTGISMFYTNFYSSSIISYFLRQRLKVTTTS
jgi:hypothetical protein